MAPNVSEYLLGRLVQWGVKRIYGYPGDGINGLIGAFETCEEKQKLKFIQVRHEEMAAFMACAHAKFTGQVGVCMATSGPGAIHLLNGLYDARMDHQPVVAIVGQTDRMAMGGDYQQEVDLLTLFKDVAREYVTMLTAPAATRHVIDRAMRIARAERTVTCVIIPKDVQEMSYERPPHKHGTVHSGVGFSSPRVVPEERDLRRAADVLNSGQRVAMLVGAGTITATDEVIAVAEALGAGVAKALLGRAALPDDLPFVTGPIGLLGSKPSWDMMQDCDTLFMVGSSFPYSEFLPKEGQARGVQIDIDGRMLSLRYPMEVNLCGDSAETLRALLPLLKIKSDRSWRKKIEDGIAEWWRVLETRAYDPGHPINPQLLFWEMSKNLPDGCIVTADSGSVASWWARDLKLRRGMMATLSGNLATMGPGVPYAVAAKFAFPDRTVIACVGDGAMQMCGNNELITVAKYWKEWGNAKWICVVLNNRDLNQVTWEQRAMTGDPKFVASQELPDFNYALYAEELGLRGLRVEKPEQVAGAWSDALASQRPFVLDVLTDPEVPPLPPHITFEQARAFMSSIAHGDPARAHMMRDSFRDVFASWFPRRKKEK